MAIEDFNHIKATLTALNILRPSRFAYRQDALDATGAAEIAALTGVYEPNNSSEINSIPAPEQTAISDVIAAVGLRTQGATVSRMMLNHFFGRLSLNLVKLTEKTKLLAESHLVNRYITPSGKVLEDIALGYTADLVTITQNKSPLAASAPETAPTVLNLAAAVPEGNAGVMTGADKKKLDDLYTAENTVVRLSGDQTIAGVKTFSSIPLLPSSDPTSDNQAIRKGYADTKMSKTGNESIAGVKTFTSIPVLPAVDPSSANEAVRKSYVDALQVGFAPIGSIIAYLPGYFTNGSNGGYAAVALTLPAAWKLCNGALYYDLESPMFNVNGRYLPNLTDGRFIRGSSVNAPVANPGSIEGNDTVTLLETHLPYHKHTNAHTHGLSQGSTGGQSANHIHYMDHSHTVGNSSDDHSVAPITYFSMSRNLYTYTSFAGSSLVWTGGATAVDGVNYGNHTHGLSGSTDGASADTGYTGSGTAFSIIPKYLTAHYIIKVK